MKERVITLKSKDDFIKETTRRIELNKELLDFYHNEYLPTLQQFDGKVYNVRFIRALQEKAAQHEFMAVSEDVKFCGNIELSIRMTQYNYNDKECLYCKCITENGRISYNASINNKEQQVFIQNALSDIESAQQAIDNYEHYIQLTQELIDKIKDFNQIPFNFRRNVNKGFNFYIY